MNIFDLTNMTAIVTGSARGLGRALAEGLHEAGAEVVLIDILASGADTARELEAAGGAPVHFVQADLMDRSTLETKFEEAVAKLGGKVDILVNNAGMNLSNPILEYTQEQWDKMFEINLNVPFRLSQLAAKNMVERGFGKIINISSITSYFNSSGGVAYAATKSALRSLTASMTVALAEQGICVNAIAPGWFETDLTSHIPASGKSYLQSRICAGRWGNMDDLKGAVIFLASHASDYVNGVTLPVDGGYVVK